MKRAPALWFLACFLVLGYALPAFGDEGGSVLISFDPAGEPVDLMTGNSLPHYTRVRRGSVRFHLYRLHEPETAVSFTHDGFQRMDISKLRSMEKVQEKFAVWRLNYEGGKNTPRIQNTAVSFVPLDSLSGEPMDRVYVKLTDLLRIDWERE